jgi:8-oxo-dGTP pyrophosphatase MutT (NUDIX family)
VREVREETGALVEPGPLVQVRDYIGRNHELADLQPGVHDIDFYFRCRLLEPPGTREATETDKRQVGIEWVALADLEAADFYPRALIPILRGERPDAPVYLGDVN